MTTNRPGEKFAYRFLYDNVNRLKTGEFFRDENGGYSPEDSFNEKNITYDANGNILSLDRYTANGIKIDQLIYGYLNGGNQIGYVQDARGDVPNVVDYPGNNSTTVDFEYDKNGNMDINRDKGINTKILYTYLNKPELIEFGSGEKIMYLYGGAGAKLAKKVIQDNTIQGSSLIYLGNFVYDWNGTMQYILTNEGRLVPDNKSYRVEYFMKDHLGNTRATYAQAAPGVPQVAEYEHYYPFGIQMEGLCRPALFDITNNHLYNGKELQPDYNLQWYDYGARFYDPQLGRFHTPDPDAESYFENSSYAYVRNNPILRIDPTGKWDVTVHLYNDRAKYGYGVAIVTDRKGNEIYRFDVRGEGTGGRNRKKDKADTPLGIYDIPDKNMWLTGGSRKSYGPNARLIMNEESGEIIQSGRKYIRIHGGRQETYIETTKTWEAVDEPTLEKTWGCLRAFDTDMSEFKSIIDNLMTNDSEEFGGKVTVKGDLKQKKSWMGVPYKSNVTKTTYHAPGEDASDEEKQNWNNLVNSILYQFKQ
ncbi:MAG: RHS repeat-associated core domain-containing protein [Bacteroidota bacterium]